MIEAEKDELIKLLADDLERSGKTEADIIRTTDRALDYDSGQFYISDHELIVFGLDPCFAPALVHAYMAFEDTHAMTVPNHFQGRISELIGQLPDLLPKPVFKQRLLSCSHFIWIARALYGLPERQAYGYFYKREMNMMGLIDFQD